MHRLMVGGTILEHELSELRLLVERQAGILLDCPNSALAAHIAEYLERHEMESPAALLDRLRASDQAPGFLPQFLDGILNSSTGFFRHPGAMNALTRQILPQLCARKSSEGPGTLRFWSAGCSTGEEAYSIAMAICDAMSNGAMSNGAANSAAGNGAGSNESGKEKNGSNKDSKEKNAARTGGIADALSSSPSTAKDGISRDWSVHIVGSDLLPTAIEVAERGLYPQSALTGLPPATIRASFSKIGASSAANGLQNAAANGSLNGFATGSSNGAPANGGSASQQQPPSNGGSHLLVKPRLRSLVTFNTMNLTKPVYIGRFDCIFCMDVLPHLSRTQRTSLLERLHLYLEPGGYLFLSQTEKLSAPNLNFRSETFDGYTFHRKPLAASAAYGR